MSCNVVSCHVMPCCAMSGHVTPCHVLLSCHVMLCHDMSWHGMSCHVISCHVLPCHATQCKCYACNAFHACCHVGHACYCRCLTGDAPPPPWVFPHLWQYAWSCWPQHDSQMKPNLTQHWLETVGQNKCQNEVNEKFKFRHKCENDPHLEAERPQTKQHSQKRL